MRWLNVSHSCSDYSAFAHASTHDAARCVSKSCSAICASPSTHHAARHSPALFALVHRHIVQLDIRLVASKSKCNCIAASSLLVMCLIYIYIYIYIYAVYIYIYLYTYIHIYIYICSIHIYIYIYIFIYIYIHTYI